MTKCNFLSFETGRKQRRIFIAAGISPESTHSGLMASQLLGKNRAFTAQKAYIWAIYPQLTPD